MAETQVRRARAEDRDAVLAFCEQTWEDGDYIADVWDRWLADPASTLLVGLVEEQPVAMVNVRMLSANESWIEGLRVDPRVRRQGIGRAVVLEALFVARDRGAVVARLFTDAGNTASRALFVATGFQQVATFIGYHAPAAASMPADLLPPGGALRTPGAPEIERLWAFLEASNLAPLTGGLLIDGWRARALTTELLESQLAAGQVWTLEAWDAVQALAIVQSRPLAVRGPRLAVQYLDGAVESIGRLALALRGEVARQGLETVSALVPDTLMLHDAMDGAGYTRGDYGALCCYAHALPPTPARP